MSHANALFTLNAAGQPIRASPEDIIAAAREHLSRRLRRGTALSSPQAVRDFLAVKLGAREFESFCCLFLDNRHRLIEFVELTANYIASCHGVRPTSLGREAPDPPRRWPYPWNLRVRRVPRTKRQVVGGPQSHRECGKPPTQSACGPRRPISGSRVRPGMERHDPLTLFACGEF